MFVSAIAAASLGACDAPPVPVSPDTDAGVTADADAPGAVRTAPPSPDAGAPNPDAGPPDAGPAPAPTPRPFVGLRDVTDASGLRFPVGPRSMDCLPDFEDCRAIGSTGALAVGDVDGDGWPDVLVAGVASGALYRNLGDGTFADVTATVGLRFESGVGGAAWGDYDRDGDLDLYATAYDPLGSRRRAYFFVQQDDGTFIDEGLARGNALATEGIHMGGTVATGDIDLDGWIDLYATEFQANRHIPHAALFRNRGAEAPGFFEDHTRAAGALAADAECWEGDGCAVTGFASSITDIDADGWPDLLMVQDFLESRLYWNDGDGTFTEGTQAARVGTDRAGMGGTVGDVDGDFDLLYVDHPGGVHLWENAATEARPWLQVRLRGTASTPEGLHARVRVQAAPEGPEQLRLVESVSHFQGQSERVAHFGFGTFDGPTLHRVTVEWPSGRQSVLSEVAVRQALVVDEPPG